MIQWIVSNTNSIKRQRVQTESVLLHSTNDVFGGSEYSTHGAVDMIVYEVAVLIEAGVEHARDRHRTCIDGLVPCPVIALRLLPAECVALRPYIPALSAVG